MKPEDHTSPRSSASLSPLSGHTLPDAGAAIKHLTTRVRLVLSWDACAADPSELRTRQVTPNHVLYEAGGEPVFGDGAPAHDEGFLDVSLEDVAAQLTAEQSRTIGKAFGSLESWARLQQPGLIGAANTVIIDGESGYFPPGERRGRLVYERRDADRHVVTAECVDFVGPRYGLTRARRTVAVSSAGIAWIADDYRGAAGRRLDWQAYLRRGCVLGDHNSSLRVHPADRPALATLAWAGPGGAVGLHRFPAYPAAAPDGPLPWPDAGSERLRIEMPPGESFAVCLVPGEARNLTVRPDGPGAWRAQWAGGSDAFHLPHRSLVD